MAHLESNRGRSAPAPARFILTGKTILASSQFTGLLPYLGFLALLLLWQISVAQGWMAGLLLPPPIAIFEAALDLAKSGRLFSDSGFTLLRVLTGVALGGIPGVFLGLLLGWSAPLRRLLDPIIAAAHPLPKIAMFPLFLILFGVGETSKVVVIATGAFFPILISTMSGVQQIHPIHFDVAANYGARRWQILKRVVLPGSLPAILTGLRLALNVTLLLTISIEMMGVRTGLGSIIWFAWETMHPENLYVALLVIIILGITFNTSLHALSRKLVPWQIERESRE
jgi:NitT/TauT family transport system permease protein